MDFGEIIKQKMAMGEMAASFAGATATIETDFANPMIFNVEMQKKHDHSHFENLDEKEKKKWLTLYPIYFAKNLSVAKGRRAALEDCIESINAHKIAFNL